MARTKAAAKEAEQPPLPEETAEETASEAANPDTHAADPLDATTTRFREEDADERGWILYREPIKDGVQRYHRVPVRHWPDYSMLHGF